MSLLFLIGLFVVNCHEIFESRNRWIIRICNTLKADENQSFNKRIIKFKSNLRVHLIAMYIYQEKRDDTRPLA